jgi:KipI family sensor histidine kinase inhibitor
MLYDNPIFRPVGDRALMVELGDKVSSDVNQAVQKLFAGMDFHDSGGILELVPSYRALMVVFDPLATSPAEVEAVIMERYRKLDQTPLPRSGTLKIPVVYGGEHGPDLEWVAGYHNRSVEDVIGFHVRPTYRVYMIGFTPGYPYLGEVVDEIATPRRQTPRTRVPRGSVGIAQKQTGIYSVDSPGGWQIIGWTPVTLFDPQRQPPSLLMMGDRVRFYAVTDKEAAQWKG